MASKTISGSAVYSGVTRTVSMTISADAGSTTCSWSVTSEPSSGTRPFTKIVAKVNDTEVVSTSYPSSFPSNANGNNFATYGGTRTGTTSVPASGNISFSLGCGVGHNNTTDIAVSDVLTRFVPNTYSANSAAIADSIVYLKATANSNGTYNGFETLDRQVEINPATGGDDTWINGYGTPNVSGAATGTLTITGADINSKGLLGTALRANAEIYYINGVAVDNYSGNYTPPANLYTNPSCSGGPVVTLLTASQVTISFPAPSWVRNESTAFYAACAASAGNIFYSKYGMSRQTLGSITFDLAASRSSGTIVKDPSSETVSAGTGYSYNFSRGGTHYISEYLISKYLGVRTTFESSRTGIYIPFLPTISAAFSYGWVNADGALYYRMTQANVTVNNPNNEYLGNGYLSLNSTKVLRASVSGNIWTANSTNSNLRAKYTNAAISGTARVWQYYATNKYSEDIIYPVETSAAYSVAANQVKCTVGTPTITQGVLKTTNVTFTVPDTNLPVGTMTAVLQVSKSSNFSTITYQQEKTVTKWGNNGQLFDAITLGKGDVGTNYVRVLWKLANSSNYYAFANVYSNTASADFTGILPKIDSMIATIQADGKIAVTVNESTGAPTPTLTIEVSKTSGGSVYQSFNATNGTAVVLPYTEPGTVWYIKAKASNVIGTVYALEADGTTQVERMIEIPYTVTDDYENVANPTITAGDVQLDGKCNFTINWTKITTNVHRVVYNVEIATSNNPISPMRHEDVQPGLSYTYDGRIDGEVVSFQLECVLYNSLGDIIATYIMFSNEITLDSVDTEKIAFVYNTIVNYHSITYQLASINKNSNKLVSMFVKLVDTETSEQVGYTFIGDEQPTSQSLDLDPIEEYVFDGLKANHKYRITVSMTGANPLDISKISTREIYSDLTTHEFKINPVKNLKYTITNIIDDIPTTASDIDMTWEKPIAGDEEPQSYIVAYKKTGQSDYTNIFLTDLHYVLAHTITDLANSDTLNVRVGAQYFDYFGSEVIKWVDLPPIVVAGTNYKYYVARYPETEIADKHIYKIVDGEDAEELVRDLYLDK